MFSFFYACSLGLLELKNYRKHGGTLPVPSGCAFHFSIYLCHYFVGHYNLNKTCLKPRHQTTTGHEHGPKIDEVYIFPFTCATGHCLQNLSLVYLTTLLYSCTHLLTNTCFTHTSTICRYLFTMASSQCRFVSNILTYILFCH